ncbi:MAG: hypothetical protein ACJAXU_002398, partial [Paracoccaceae bacterium]
MAPNPKIALNHGLVLIWVLDTQTCKYLDLETF